MPDMLALMNARSLSCSLALLVLASVLGPAVAQTVEPVRVHVNGVDLSYIERGHGAPVILLHGGLGDYESWQPQFDSFASHFRVIAYSRRFSFPNVSSPAPPNFSAWTDVDDLSALVRKLRLRDVRLVGQSAGAFVALAFALKHSDVVHSLVLSEPPAHQLARNTAEGEAAYQNFVATVMDPAAEYFRKGDVQRAMSIFVDGMAATSRFDSLSPEARAAVMRNARSIEALALSSDPFPALAREDLRRLRVPTLIVTGENTIPVHRLVDEELTRLLPNVESVTIPNAGRASPRENSPAFNEAVLAFLVRDARAN